MTERTCIFAYTPNDPVYPPYLNFSVVDGKLIVTMRGAKRTPGDTDYPFDMPGHGVSMELPDDQAEALTRALMGQQRIVDGAEFR